MDRRDREQDLAERGLLGPEPSPSPPWEPDAEESSGDDYSSFGEYCAGWDRSPSASAPQSPKEEGELCPLNTFVEMPPPPHPQKPTTSASTLLHLPPDLKKTRQAVFKIENTINWTPAQYQSYWDFVDNFWVKNKTSPKSTSGLWTGESISEGKGKRQKQLRNMETCGMKLKVLKKYDPKALDKLVSVELSRHIVKNGKGCTTHSHSMEYIDEIKLNTKFRRTAGDEVAKGNNVAGTKRLLAGTKWTANKKALHEAGGKHLSLLDAHNAGRVWKAKNPDERIKTSSHLLQAQYEECLVFLENEPGMLAVNISAKRSLDGEMAYGTCWAKKCEWNFHS